MLLIDSNGDRVVIGAYCTNSYQQASEGAAYVFTRSGTTWSQEALLLETPQVNNNLFGNHVSINGNGDVLVASNYTNNNSSAITVFTRSGTTWTQEYRSDYVPYPVGSQIHSLDISANGKVIAVGIPHCTVGVKTNAGSVNLYKRNTSNVWYLYHTYVKYNTQNDDEVGTSVSLSGDGAILAIGTKEAGYNNLTSAGAVDIIV